jgi:enoyl-CoA hydratase/carnithine racemase
MSGLLRPLVDFLARLRSCERPVIAAVNGACAAGGLEMVLCCDLIVASSEATFSDAHSRRGIAPAIGGAAGLVRSLGAHRAKQLLLLADNYDADTMAALGLVAEVVAPAELLNRVEVMTETLGRRSPDSLRLAKRMVHRSQDPDWDRNVEADLTDFRNGWGSADMREGMRAYVEHRQPAFRR